MTEAAPTSLPRLTSEQSKGIEAAVRHLRGGPDGWDGALGALTEAGFSERRAKEIIAAIVAELIAAARRKGS